MHLIVMSTFVLVALVAVMAMGPCKSNAASRYNAACGCDFAGTVILDEAGTGCPIHGS